MTLIEVMIAIAVMAILFAGWWQGSKAFPEFLNQNNYNLACHVAEQALLNIKNGKNFPPEVHVVPWNRIVVLNHTPISKKLKVYLDGKILPSKDYDLKPETRKVIFLKQLRGERIVINYKMRFPPWKEICTVSEHKPYKIVLGNTPIQKVFWVKEAEGNRLRLLSPSSYQVNFKSGIMQFKGIGGKVVLISYYGGKFTGALTGKFISSNLKQERLYPTDWKMLKLTLKISGQRPWLHFFTIIKS
jgi:prepilin-type N-terminal cleavage/methylation domain-containing protein